MRVTWRKGLKFRIIISTAVCILIVGLVSNLCLYFYLNKIITEKAANIDQLNLQTVQEKLNQKLQELSALGNVCSNDLDIAKGMRNTSLASLSSKKEVLRAQEALQNYLSAFSIEGYVNRLIVFNQQGVSAQAITRKFSELEVAQMVMQQPCFAELVNTDQHFIAGIAPSIIEGEETLVYISRVYEYPSAVQRGYLYIEMDASWITDVFLPYGEYSLFLVDENHLPYPRGSAGMEDEFIRQNLTDKEYLSYGDSTYHIMSLPLNLAELVLYSRADVTFLVDNRNPVFYTTEVVILASLSVALMLAVLLSNIITKPLQKLKNGLIKIAEKNFEYNEEIEHDGSEIGQMGQIVNQMTSNINRLLEETEQMHIQQKNAEIALLQSQINPHFLYNTLDSIRWMAVIQKNPGIEKTVKSLSNLLKNLAKGIGDKITLEEEMKLLKDYVDTQSVRFMQMFELENRISPDLYSYQIVKFTLQPLVENAIFHGIEPSGKCGAIILDAHLEGEYLIITVEDNGVGMTVEELEKMKESFQKPHPKGMAGIGVTNVDHRLKLTYGEECGVFFESEKNQYTRVTVKIQKEAADVSL